MGEGGQRIQTSSYNMNKFCQGGCVISSVCLTTAKIWNGGPVLQLS